MTSVRASLTRRVRPVWTAAALWWLWGNRTDVRRWVGFLRRSVRERRSRPMSEAITEAKVRASVSADRAMRTDPALRDLSVHQGVVTLMTTREAKPDGVDRLRRIKGVSTVNSHVGPLTVSTIGR